MASCKLCGVHFFPNTFILPRKFQRDVPERLFFVKFALVERLPHTVMYLVAISTQ